MIVPSAFAEEGGGEGRRPGARSGQRMTPEQWRERMDKLMGERLQQAGVTDEQLPAVKKALKAKQEAREAYTAKLTELNEKLKDPFISDADITAALKVCREALAVYRKVVKEQDDKIIATVSPMAQAKLFQYSIIDNGLGRPAGISRRGGFGGRGGTAGGAH